MAATANAQFVVSAYLGGAQTKMSSTLAVSSYDTNLALVTTTKEYQAPIPLTLTGGLKLGYQVGRVQFGISGSYTWNHAKGTMELDEYIRRNQAFDTSRYTDRFVGKFSESYSQYTIAPYVRVEYVQFGDVALFLEVNGFYSVTNKPARRDSVDWYYADMHNTIDTNYTVEKSGNAFGASLVPGMTWQLTPHCHIELYLDFLAFSFKRQSVTETTVFDIYDTFGGGHRVARRETTTTTQTSQDIGFAITGTPLLGSKNFVRVGFCYTF